MSGLPRIAVGTIQPEADGTAMLWALMDALEHVGLRVQNFLPHAYFASRDGATVITGLAPRHLDSWLMPRDLCRQVFVRGARSSDLAVVEGTFGTLNHEPGGDLDTLCDWLELPRLAIVDARLLGECRLPERPENVDGLLLDRVSDMTEGCRLETLFESLWNIPVLGCLGQLAGLRAIIDGMSPYSQPSLGLCHALGNQFSQRGQLERIYRIAGQRRLLAHQAPCRAWHQPSRRVQVAVAYDDCFHGYFPDTLDLLEMNGAAVCDFSPLRDERLPPGTDVVYLGCGHPELFADELADNDCMLLALKSHLCGGRRMYAECGGLAYLCQQIEMPDSQCLPMAGVLPAKARLNPAAAAPTASEITLTSDTWLSQAGACWRGYLNSRWTIEPHGCVEGCAAEPGHEFDVLARHLAIGSRMHLNFAAQPDLLDHFFEPRAARSAVVHVPVA
jgi:cobyrinic acid a,c-diamide synthase